MNFIACHGGQKKLITQRRELTSNSVYALSANLRTSDYISSDLPPHKHAPISIVASIEDINLIVNSAVSLDIRQCSLFKEVIFLITKYDGLVT